MKKNKYNKLKILFSFSLSFFLFSMISFFVWSFHIPSQSMYPNLIVGDNTLSTRFETIDVGEIYSFQADQNYIKRLIAKEGDTIKFVKTKNKKYNIYINDQKLIQEELPIEKVPEKKLNSVYEFYGHLDFDFFLETINNRSYIVMYKHNKHLAEHVIDNYLLREFSYTLKENELFFLGDNRNASADSRYYGATTTNQVNRHAKTILYNNNFLTNKNKRYFLEKI